MAQKKERQKKAKGSVPLEERKAFFLGQVVCKKQVLKSTRIRLKKQKPKQKMGAGGWKG